MNPDRGRDSGGVLNPLHTRYSCYSEEGQGAERHEQGERRPEAGIVLPPQNGGDDMGHGIHQYEINHA
jgi:hypothetical protein